MTRILGLVLLLFVYPCGLLAQQLAFDRMSTYAYEDMGDWLRRFHGIYQLDYGVAGAPLLLRPWGLNSWNLGVERDGIPWQRVSDGLYESNLDSPEEFESIELAFDGLDPLSTLRLKTKWLPSDSATTVVRLREGYYGFGRVDFAHAQMLNRRLHAEAHGRLFWYDGLRSEANNQYSKSRFYNLSGKFRYDFRKNVSGLFEYGGSNVEARSPTVIFENSNFSRPTIKSEREFGTAWLEIRDERMDLNFGVHARQDRETRVDPDNGRKYFGLRELFWYGYGEASIGNSRGSLSARFAGESSAFNFTGANRNEDAASAVARFAYDLDLVRTSARAFIRQHFGNNSERELDLVDRSVSASVRSTSLKGISIVADASYGEKGLPQYWRYASLSGTYRPIPVADDLIESVYYGGLWRGFEYERDLTSTLAQWAGGLAWQRGTGSAELRWRSVSGTDALFDTFNDTTFLYGVSGVEAEWTGPQFTCDVPVASDFSVQSWTTIQFDKNGLARALDSRSFTRLNFSRDFFTAPLKVESYLAYEFIGRHRAASDVESKVLGPAHMVHFRIEGTIEGVTLIWGAENLTGQHYEYLPGYLMIRKEEYFGLKWTLKL